MKSFLIAATSLAVSAATAHAGPLAPFMPSTVKLTARTGRFSKWEKSIPCSAGSYSTTITLSDLNPGDPWESAAQIILKVPNIRGTATFNIMTIYRKTPLQALLEIRGKDRENPEYSQYSNISFEPGKPIDVSVTWASTRGVEIVINNRHHLSASMRGAISALEVTASGATARFDKNQVVCTLIS